MSVAANLPSYADPFQGEALNRAPSYTAEPHRHEQRLAQADRVGPRPSGAFIKEKNNVRLRLTAQENGVELPVYGIGEHVTGVVELSKPAGITSVEVKIEGRLRIKENAEGGTAIANLVLDTAVLWFKDRANPQCPESLSFSLALPTTFTYADVTYPLPPSFEAKLDGLPGFVADIEYSVTALVGKPNGVPLPKMNSKALGIHIGTNVVSTPFIYFPRSKPSAPLPLPLIHSPDGFIPSDEWTCVEAVVRSKKGKHADIIAKFYVPATRIFCMSLNIPFHLTFESNAVALAAFLPYSPSQTNGKKQTKLELLRQTTVDVKNEMHYHVKTDMWRVDCIGEGTFKHAGDGPSVMSFSGEIALNDLAKVPGFKAAGLSVRDCIILTVTPPDPGKALFCDTRLAVPIRLTTEPWTPNGAGMGSEPPAFWDPPTPPDQD
ncbi:hypothetical protein D9619_007113 [Psilocybe cf. subviscida]|uniref:Uncharacterized protein n=1 Tax=Psilocybe cf. subviscida TaxID=2480587 RepID=A0A8H5B2D8_9AGAR|nr:hypothetical protein D9619_007113 [Psilocybe cf. subviscida]